MVTCKLCNNKEALDNNSLCVECNDFVNKTFPEFSTDPNDFHIEVTKPSVPMWTVLYPTQGETWIGAAWEFFDTKITADARANELKSKYFDAVVVRPFDFFRDIHALRKTWQK